jgi:L-asparaginase/Glu-tRNA(Gln) amidotransferase subunit D
VTLEVHAGRGTSESLQCTKTTTVTYRLTAEQIRAIVGAPENAAVTAVEQYANGTSFVVTGDDHIKIEWTITEETA